MRYFALALLGAVSCYGAMILRASCTIPWASFPDEFQGYPAGAQVPGSGFSDTSVLNAAGSASVGCASVFPEGTAVPIGAQIQVDATSLSAAVPIVNILTNPRNNGALDYGNAFTQASISGSLTGMTAGPVRPGLLYLTGSGRVWSFRCCKDNPVVTVAGHNVSLADPAEGPPQSQGPFPVMLGVSFTIAIDKMSGLIAFPSEAEAAEAQVQWRFTELNDTPAAVTFIVTPEPSTFQLGAVAAIAVAVFALASARASSGISRGSRTTLRRSSHDRR